MEWWDYIMINGKIKLCNDRWKNETVIIDGKMRLCNNNKRIRLCNDKWKNETI